jgi:hypothetical protein
MAVRTIVFFLNLVMPLVASASVPPKKPIVTQPEIKRFALLSLKHLCFGYGIKMYGKDFIKEFEKNSNKQLKSTMDLTRDADEYYLRLCCREIDQMLGRPYPESLWKEPPAQPLNKLVMQVYEKKRFELLAIINRKYYAELKWPAITLLASAAGYLGAVKILLDAGADINARNFYKRTPLICAARNGHTDVVEYFIQLPETNIDAIDLCNYDAIRHAAERKHQKIYDLLCDKKKEKEDLKKNVPFVSSERLRESRDG